MSAELRPIETSYRGYRFRSRLEARWAVFLDAAQIPWEYEAQGFDFDGVYYLPDFWLPGDRTFLEIKPYKPGEYINLVKQITPTLVRLVDASECEAYLIIGSPTPNEAGPQDRPHIIGFAPHKGICSARLFECQFCGRVSIKRFVGSAFDAVCLCRPGLVFEDTNYKMFDWSPRLQHAMQEARRARFEHGEDGAPRPYWSAS